MSHAGLHVARWGHGPDLVAVHGWGMHGGIWAPPLEALGEYFRIHAIDLPGHGYSAGVPWPEDTTALDEMLATAVPADAFWLGWSLGGTLALRQALHGNAAGLVLCASNPCFLARPGWPHGMDPATFRGFRESLMADPRAALERFLALEVHGSENAGTALRRLRRRALERGTPVPAALARGLTVLGASDLVASLATLSDPVLVLGGRRDRLVPRQALEAATAALADARLVLIRGAAHAPFIGHRSVFTEAITDFAADRDWLEAKGATA